MVARLTVVVLLLSLCTACATTHAVHLDTGRGTPVESRLLTAPSSLKVSAAVFEESLTLLLLSAPLSLPAPQQGGVVRATHTNEGTAMRWQYLMSKGLGGICGPGSRGTDCFSLLEDVAGMSEREKLGVTLGLSLVPLKKSISKALEETVAPQLFYTAIVTGLVAWAVLAANPEPVFTKAAAIISAILLIGLGVESFLELVEASQELTHASDKAVTAAELDMAAQRFANRMGPEVARVFILAVTMAFSQGMTGGAAWLAARLRMLPLFSEAAAASGASQMGLTLASAGQVSAVAVAGNTIVISLPSTVMAMVAHGQQIGATSTANGQLHHIISKRIARALEEHATLRGHYSERDPRFVTRAANKAAHNGYQQWHRDVDDEVIAWLEKAGRATPEEFESFLRRLYARPALRARFPHGF